jgi:hypothetical protein
MKNEICQWIAIIALIVVVENWMRDHLHNHQGKITPINKLKSEAEDE